MDASGSVEVCHCIGVRRDTLLRAIVDGCRTVEDLQRVTAACTGCRSCRPDLDRLLSAGAGPGAAAVRSESPPER